jgi:hypothetical protein
MSTIQIRDGGGGRTLGTMTLVQVGALGRINPRLLVTFKGHASLYAKLELDELVLRLEHRGELIGEGAAPPGPFNDSLQVAFEVVTSHRLLAYITDSLSPSANSLQLVAKIRGRGQFSVKENEPGLTRLATDPEPGAWTDATFTRGTETALTVARSDWYERVVKVVSGDNYTYLEIAVPAVEPGMNGSWRNVVDQLDEAERMYALGHDAAVFQHLRAAYEALPGSPDAIVASIANERKQKAVDDLLRQFGGFLHLGRHVTKVGSDAGTFPVSHQDARFALDLMKVTLAHLSGILGSEQRASSN